MKNHRNNILHKQIKHDFHNPENLTEIGNIKKEYEEKKNSIAQKKKEIIAKIKNENEEERRITKIKDLLDAMLSIAKKDDDFTLIINKINDHAKKIGNDTFHTTSIDHESKATPPKKNNFDSQKNLLEMEILNIINKAKKGEDVFPPYNKRDYNNPLIYLEQYYGKFLKKYNNERDYIYQFQLQIIDRKFRNNLRMFLSNHNQDINDFIPSKADKIENEIISIKNKDSHYQVTKADRDAMRAARHAMKTLLD